MPGQIVQVPPPPGTMHVAAVPAGAMLPPGTVQGSMVPAGAVMQGMVSGAVPVMTAPHQGTAMNAAQTAPAGDQLVSLAPVVFRMVSGLCSLLECMFCCSL